MVNLQELIDKLRLHVETLSEQISQYSNTLDPTEKETLLLDIYNGEVNSNSQLATIFEEIGTAISTINTSITEVEGSISQKANTTEIININTEISRVNLALNEKAINSDVAEKFNLLPTLYATNETVDSKIAAISDIDTDWIKNEIAKLQSSILGLDTIVRTILPPQIEAKAAMSIVAELMTQVNALEYRADNTVSSQTFYQLSSKVDLIEKLQTEKIDMTAYNHLLSRVSEVERIYSNMVTKDYIAVTVSDVATLKLKIEEKGSAALLTNVNDRVVTLENTSTNTKQKLSTIATKLDTHDKNIIDTNVRIDYLGEKVDDFLQISGLSTTKFSTKEELLVVSSKVTDNTNELATKASVASHTELNSKVILNSTTIEEHTAVIATLATKAELLDYTQKTDHDDLGILVNTNTTDIEKLKLSVANKVDTLTFTVDMLELTDTVNSKASAEVVAGISNTLTSRLDSVSTGVATITSDIEDLTIVMDSKAPTSDVNALEVRVIDIETTLGTSSTSVEDITGRVEILESDIQDKLDASIYQTYVENTATTLDTFATKVSLDAIDNAVTDLGTRVANVEERFDTKADASLVTPLQTQLGEVKASIATIESDLVEKAEQSTLDTLIGEVNIVKANINTVTTHLNNKLDTDYSSNVESSLDDMANTIGALSNKIDVLEKQIADLVVVGPDTVTKAEHDAVLAELENIKTRLTSGGL